MTRRSHPGLRASRLVLPLAIALAAAVNVAAQGPPRIARSMPAATRRPFPASSVMPTASPSIRIAPQEIAGPAGAWPPTVRGSLDPAARGGGLGGIERAGLDGMPILVPRIDDPMPMLAGSAAMDILTPRGPGGP